MKGKDPSISAGVAVVSAFLALFITFWALNKPYQHWPAISLAGAFPGLTLPLWLEFRDPASRQTLLGVSLAYLAGALALFATTAFDLWGMAISSIFLPFSLFHGRANPAVGLASLVIAGGLGYLAMKTGAKAKTLVKAGFAAVLALVLPVVLWFGLWMILMLLAHSSPPAHGM
jgi:hypothetical protein